MAGGCAQCTGASGSRQGRDEAVPAASTAAHHQLCSECPYQESSMSVQQLLEVLLRDQAVLLYTGHPHHPHAG